MHLTWGEGGGREGEGEGEGGGGGRGSYMMQLSTRLVENQQSPPHPVVAEAR